MDILNAKGKPLRNSASATETWRDCKRKWAYGYYWRVERVSSPAAEIGNKVHDVLETYLKTGEKPKEENNRYWRIAEPGLQFLPEVSDTGVTGNWLIEEWVECQCGPLPFVGKVDLYNLQDFDRIQIDDHKTTGDGSWRWAKTPNQLAELIQPHAYAWSIVQVHGLTPPESVDFRHIYYCTRGQPKAMEVRATEVPWEDIEKTWRELENISNQMAVVATSVTVPEEVEATTTSCKKYGGCAYADRCAASPLNRNKKTKIEPTVLADAYGSKEQEEEMSDRLSALRAQLGINKAASNATISSAPRVREARNVPDPQGDAQALADKLSRALDGGSPLPVSAAEAMARSAEVHLYEAMQIANLHNVNGFLVSKELSMAEADEVTAQDNKQGWTDQDPVLEGWINYLAKNNDRMSRKDAQAIVREVTGAQRVRKERGREYVEVFIESYSEYSLVLEGNVLSLVSATITKSNSTNSIAAGMTLKEASASEKQLSAMGYKLLYGLIVPENFTGSATETYQKYRPDSLHLVAALSSVETPAKDSGVTDLPFLTEATSPAPRHAKEEVTSSVAPESNALLPTTDPKDTPLGRIVKEVATPTIYIDCIPEDPAGVYSFTDFVRSFEQEVEQEGGKVNDSFIQPLPYYGLLDYGQGPKRVAGKVLAALHRAGPQLFRGDMYVDGKHPLADEIIPILRRLKGVRVVRASR